MDLTRVDTVVQFTAGSANVWNNVNVPVPAGAIVIDTVNKIIKEGDGTNLFANLPICLDYNFTFSTSGAITPVGSQVGMIAIADDSLYSPSTRKMSDFLGAINSAVATDVTIDAAIAAQANVVVASVAGGTPDGTIVICSDGKYTPGTKTLTQLIADLIIQSTVYGSKMHINDLEWYADNTLSEPLSSQNDIQEHGTYFCKITGSHDIAEQKIIDYGLSTTQNNIIVTNTAGEETCALIAAVYGGNNNDSFSKIVIDSQGNIYAVGYIYNEGAGDCLIIKYDKDLNIIASKRYGGYSVEYFIGATIDSNDNLICVGFTYSETVGDHDAIVVKFNSDLVLIAAKRCGTAPGDQYYNVAVDSNNNIYCVGYGVFAAGQATSAGIVIKYDPNLNLLLQYVLYGINDDYVNDIAIDKQDNIYIAAHTYSENVLSDAVVCKLDTSLNLIFKKRYGGAGDDIFKTLTTDKNGNVYVVGTTGSEGPSVQIYLVKFDSSLNILINKQYGGTGTESVEGIVIDDEGNVITVGSTNSDGGGTTCGLLLKFDVNLNLVTKKICKTNTSFSGVRLDKSNNLIISGTTQADGSGGSEALVMKIPKNIPSGSLTGTILSGLTLADTEAITVNASAGTMANSGLTWSATSLSHASITTLVVNETNLASERDVITAARKTTPTKLITAIYSSANDDKYNAVAKGANGEFYCAGYTAASGVEIPLIVRYDANFNVLARKVLNTGLYSGKFNDVACGSTGAPTCVGEFVITSGGAIEAFIIRLENDLATILYKKSFGSAGADSFLRVRFAPDFNSIIAVGYTASEGSGLKDALVVKFTLVLTISYKKRYGGTGNDELNGIGFDSVGNVICVGYTASEGTNTSGLILKLDSNLNIVLRKYYNSTLGTLTEFDDVAVASDNTVYVCGKVTTATGDRGLVIKMDTSLNVAAAKLYGNSNGSTEFSSISLDPSQNVICVGKTTAEGAGSTDALIVKLNAYFAILGRKTYGTFGADGNIDCVLDTDGSYVIAGYAVINNSTDGIVSRIPASLPVGLYTSKKIPGLALSDSQLTLYDDAPTLGNSTLTMADSAMVTANRAFVMIDSSGGSLSDSIILDAVPNVFKVQIGEVIGTETSVPVNFTVTTDDGNDVVTKTVGISVKRASIIAAIYGGTGQDDYSDIAIDSAGNVYCVGLTYSEGNGSQGLIVKYNNTLNLVLRKVYGGTGNEAFTGIAFDSQGNLFVSCYANTNAWGPAGAVIIKFDKDLNILIQRNAAGADNDSFSKVVVDHEDNVICAGYSWSQGYGSAEAIIVKFTNSLQYLNQINIGGSQSESSYSVCVDSNNNIILAGWTYTEGAGAPTYHGGIIYKYDKNLNLMHRKVLHGVNDVALHDVITDEDDNIYVCGGNKCEGTAGSPTYADAMIVKFDPNLEILAKKRYGTSGDDNIYELKFTDDGNIMCCGYVSDTANAVYKALIMKVDRNLNIISKKKYGGVGYTWFRCMDIDSAGNVFVAGSTTVETFGVNDCIAVKFPPSLPPGSFTGVTVDELTLSDETLLVEANSVLSVGASTLNSVAGGLSIGFASLGIANSTASAKREVINL